MAWDSSVSPGATVACMSDMALSSSWDEVDDREDDDPHDVDEVPVEAGDLDHLGPGLRDLAADRHAHQRQQHQDAERHVHAVEAGEDEERPAGDVGPDRHA